MHHSRLTELARLQGSPCKRVLGLMAGTSCDGIDVAIVDIGGELGNLTISTHSASTYPYSETLRSRLLLADSASLPELVAMDRDVADAFIDAAVKHIAECCSDQRVDLIGSHGQTIWHAPPSQNSSANSWQIGDGDFIASALEIPVVSDFRRRDIALGGEGAPLVPYVDALFFADPTEERVALNIGGIANCTILVPSQPIQGTDSGPGNMLIDLTVSEFSEGRTRFDPGGEIASRGRVNESLLARLLKHDFFELPLPRSTGREQFGRGFLDWMFTLADGLQPEDWVATVTALTASSISRTLHRAGSKPSRVIVSGGGVHNPTLLGFLKDFMPGVSIESSAIYGIDPDSKEAVAFAVLAHETLMGRPSNVPSVTGASKSSILGKISL